MEAIKIHIEFPRSLLGAMDVPEKQLNETFKELIVLELVRSNKVSSGKGAELLGKKKFEFVDLMAKNNIPYFTESPEELADQVRSADCLLKMKNG